MSIRLMRIDLRLASLSWNQGTIPAVFLLLLLLLLLLV